MSHSRIPEETRRALYRRAGGQCECMLSFCRHHAADDRCTNSLYSDSWEAYQIKARPVDSLRNLIAMCPQCHHNSQTAE